MLEIKYLTCWRSEISRIQGPARCLRSGEKGSFLRQARVEKNTHLTSGQTYNLKVDQSTFQSAQRHKYVGVW